MDDERDDATESDTRDPGSGEEVGMSVAAQLVHEAGLTPEQAEYVGIPMSWDEYEALGGDVRGEYIGGRLYVSAFATPQHQRVIFRLQRQFDDQLPEGYEINGTIGWKPAADEFGPDLIVYRAADCDETAPRFTGRPLLVVEVLSQKVGRDTILKAHRYAKLGVPQYWLVNPEGVIEVLVLEPDEGTYRIETRLTDTEQAVKLPDGTEVTIDPKAIFTR